MVVQRYEQVLEQLEECFAFCRSLGLDLANTRFGVYRERLKRLQEVIERGDAPMNPPSLPDGLSERDYIFPLSEAGELVGLLPFMKATPEGQYRQKLELMTRGPVLPSEEDSDSNQARNLLFELSLAAILWCAGITPRRTG